MARVTVERERELDEFYTTIAANTDTQLGMIAYAYKSPQFRGRGRKMQAKQG